MWPTINPEAEQDELEFDALIKPDAWVHYCPILSHHGVVLPFELPEPEEQQQDEDENADAEDEDEEQNDDGEKEKNGEEGEGEDNEEEEEKEPPPPTAQERLNALYQECD